MSFSFRNIFTPDEDGIDGIPSGFEPAGGGSREHMARRGSEAKPTAAEAPGQDFLISELIAFIPPAISAQSGIPMTRELRIPLPADGSRDVKLSTIYQLCPELFAAEITPLNDSVVTLPPKIGAMGTMGGASGFSPTGEKLVSGFSGTPSATGNPFWSPTPTAAEEKRETDAPGVMKDETPGPIARAAPLSEPKMPSGFESPAALPENGDKVFSGGKSGFGSPSSSALFGRKGIAATNKADDKGSNPLKNTEPFSTLFSKQANADMDIPCPTGATPTPPSEVGKPGDEHQGVWGAMFQGGGFPESSDAAAGEEKPFTPPAFESIGNLLKQASGSGADSPSSGFPSASESGVPPTSAPMTPAQPIATGFSAFEAAPGPLESTSATRGEISPAATQGNLPPNLGSPASTAPAQTFAGFGTNTAQKLSPIDTFADAPAFEPLDFTEKAPSPIVESAPDPIATPNSKPVQTFRREMTESVPAREAAPAQPESGNELRDLELRAIFSTSETFTLSMVARRIVGLPGIVNCTLSTPGKLVQASKTDSGRLGNEAREMVATLRNLAKLTGLPEARTFTLHTDCGIVSLFLEGDCCVMVNHETASFEPGVREKLILVARSLIKLEE